MVTELQKLWIWKEAQDLAQLVAKVSPSHDPNKHPATRVFQAVRIQVNQELKDIDECLAATPDLLEIGGRLVVISFHSLEDRRAKRFIKQQGDRVVQIRTANCQLLPHAT